MRRRLPLRSVIAGVLLAGSLLLAACGDDDQPAADTDTGVDSDLEGGALALADESGGGVIEFTPTTPDPDEGEGPADPGVSSSAPSGGVLGGRTGITADEAALLASMLESEAGRALLVEILTADGSLDLEQATCFVEQAEPAVVAAIASEATTVADLSVFDPVMAACGIEPDAFG